LKLQVQCELKYQVNSYATSIFSFLALKTTRQQVLEESLTVTPRLQVEELAAGADPHRFIRLELKVAAPLHLRYLATVQTLFEEVPDVAALEPVLVARMPAAVFPYLLPSRYCQSDHLLRFAQHHFGHLENDFSKVKAITKWIHANVEYVSGSSNAQTGALDTITQQAGVCRDFAHLAISLCRALTIPARYFTCYAYKLSPPDFHACFEAYLGGRWIVFDATRLAPLNGLVKIAHGRDAADVAIATSFGDISLTSIQVGCQTLDNLFVPVFYQENQVSGLAY
jgi:transglutaminase-like putative cysteine protease